MAANHDIFSFVVAQTDYRLRKIIHWGLKDSFVDRLGRFSVERSLEGGPFVSLNDDVDGMLLIVDDKGLEPRRDARYRVVFHGVYRTYTSDAVLEGEMPCSKLDLQYATAMYRRELMTLERYSGIPGQLLKRRRTGEVCQYCVDESVGASTRSNCPHCLGTGLAGGYYPGVDYTVNLLGAPDTTKITDTGIGTIEPGNLLKGRGVFERWLERGDIWVSASNGDRFELLATSPEVVYKDLVITVTLALRRLSTADTSITGIVAFEDKLLPPRTISVRDIFG